jgi:hypothetical protein
MSKTHHVGAQIGVGCDVAVCSTPQRCVGRLHFVNETCRRSFGIQEEHKVRDTHGTPCLMAQSNTSGRPATDRGFHISPPQLLISDRKDVLRISAYGSHDRPLWLLRRIQCIMASNDEVVALSVCTILMVGSILKSAAAQIGHLGANPLQESAWRKK